MNPDSSQTIYCSLWPGYNEQQQKVHFYYLDSAPYAGHEYEIDAKSLRFGILLVYGDSGDPNQHSLLLAGLTRKEMSDTIARYKERYTLGKTFQAKKAFEELKGEPANFHGIRVFEGSVSSLDKDFVLYDLNCHSFSKDHLSMLFYYRNPNQDSYIGGLGEGVSISRGHESTPCAQGLRILFPGKKPGKQHCQLLPELYDDPFPERGSGSVSWRCSRRKRMKRFAMIPIV